MIMEHKKGKKMICGPKCQKRRKKDKTLDRDLANTFPASDPVTKY
jgi:hypothetical protein